jgi:alpha-tubulin suppressor-like RCC1 family protein
MPPADMSSRAGSAGGKKQQDQATLWARVGGEEYERRSQIRFSLMATNQPMNIGGESRSSSRSGTFIWTWGAGFHGQLGRKSFPRGRKKSIPRPEVLEFPSGITLCQVSCGGYHTMALTDTGRIFSWGHGTEGQLGYVLDGFGVQNAPREVDSWSVLKTAALHISCGQEHSAAVSKRGEVYCWGLGKNGQLGQGNKNSSAVPVRARNVDHAVSVSCGSGHTVAKTETGRLFTWGEGNQGQLGHGSLDDLFMPKAVGAFDGPKKVKTATCGATLTAVITQEGDLMMCGLGDNLFAPTKEGENRASCSTEPMHMFPGTKVKQVACGRGHVVMLDEAGDVWCWGNNNYCQLGDGSNTNSHIPRCVMQGKQVESIACGRYHTLAAATCGVVYSWGCGESGQLGHGATGPLGAVPKMMTALTDRVCGQITCGEHHNCVITSGEMSGHGTDWLQFKYYEEKEQQLKAGLAAKFNVVSRANLTEVEQLIEHHVNINKMREDWPEDVKAPEIPLSPWEEDGSIRQLPVLLSPPPKGRRSKENEIVGMEVDVGPEDPLDALRRRVSSRFGKVLTKVSTPRSSTRQISVQLPQSPNSPAISAPSRPQTANEPGSASLVPQPPSQPSPKSPASSRASIRFLLENAELEGPTDNAAVQKKIADENKRAEKELFDQKYGAQAIEQSIGVLRDKEKDVYKKRGPTGAYEGVLLPRMLFFSETERLLQKTRRVTQNITVGKSAISSLQGRVHRLRIKHDSFVGEARMRQKRLEGLKTEHTTNMQQQQIRDEDMHEAQAMEVSTRTMFESVLSRVAEVEENIQSSILVISQLKQEAVEKRDMLELLRAEHTEGSTLHRRLGFVERKAKMMSDECDNQLEGFKGDIERTKSEQKAQVTSFRGVLDERYEASQQANRLAARKKLAQKRERERLQKEHMQHLSEHMQGMKEDMLQDTTVALREEYFKQGFVRIKEVSKMETVDDIIYQHFVNADTNVLLTENKHLQAQRLSELQAQKAIMSGQLNLLEQARGVKTGLKELNTMRMKMQRVEAQMVRIVKVGKEHKATLTKVENSLKHHVQRAIKVCVNVPVPATLQSGGNHDSADYLAMLTEILVGAQAECLVAGFEDVPGADTPAFMKRGLEPEA